MNQNLASCAALWNAGECVDDRRLKRAFEAVWMQTLRHQSSEGWFPEYGGADVGYSLLALDLLGSLYTRRCPDALAAAQPLCRFLASFGYPGSDFAGGLGSRGTAHAFAYGAEVFAPHLQEAVGLATNLRAGLKAKRLCRPESVDDRYLAYFYLPSSRARGEPRAFHGRRRDAERDRDRLAARWHPHPPDSCGQSGLLVESDRRVQHLHRAVGPSQLRLLG